MKIDIVAIGNSKGIRLPKVLLERYGLKDTAELETTEDGIMLRQPRSARAGWDEAFNKISPKRKQTMLDDETFDTSFDDKDWAW